MADFGDPILGLGDTNSGYGIPDIETPGAIAAAYGGLPILPSPAAAVLSSIIPDSLPPLTLPMPTSSISGYVNSTNSNYNLGSGSGYSSLTNGLVGIGQSLTAAFVTNPANAATQAGLAQNQATIAEQEALLNAGLQTQQSTASTTSLFTILLFAALGFIVYKLVER